MDLIKCAVVGDANSGKTLFIDKVRSDCLIDQKYQPTIIKHTCLKPMTIDGKEMKVFLNETTVTGRIDLVNTCFRQIAPITDMIVLCLNVVSEKSRDNFLKLWSPAIKEYASKIPVILIGTKFDLRYEEDIVDGLKRMGSKPIDSDEGRELGRQINALRYYECSAVIDSHYYMENIFGEAVKGALYAKKNLKAYK